MFWGVLLSDSFGLEMGPIRTIVVLGYILFIPGICVVRSLRLHKLGTALTLLYSVGTSVAVLMLGNGAVSLLLRFAGVAGSMSLLPLAVSVTAFVTIFCIVCFKRDRGFNNPTIFQWSFPPSAPVLILCLIVVLGALGPRFLMTTGNNSFSLMVILAIATLVFLVATGVWFPERLYPSILFSTSLGLLYTSTLISNNLVEWADISFEYWTSAGVVSQGAWDPTAAGSLNGVLSLTVLAPTISILSGISVLMTFKLVFPLLLSLVPPSLYLL